MWTVHQFERKIYITNGTDIICMGKDRTHTLRTAEAEATRRNNGGDPTRIEHDNETILRLCRWGAKHIRKLFKIYKKKCAPYDERYAISSMCYVRAIQYFKPNQKNGFTIYYQKALWRIAYAHFIQRVTTSIDKPLKPLTTGATITDDMIKHSQRHTLGKEQPKIYDITPIPYNKLHARDASIVRDIIENDQTFEETSKTHGLTKQRVHQLYLRGIRMLREYYLAQ